MSRKEDPQNEGSILINSVRKALGWSRCFLLFTACAGGAESELCPACEIISAPQPLDTR